MSILEINNVSATLAGAHVPDGIELRVGAGEFVSILGPSGAGKSTIFRLLTCALEPDRGNITFDGAPLNAASREFAFMPQRDALMPWRRILDNVTLGLEVQGVPRHETRARVMPLLDDFGL